jgi:molybdopterin synthase catalytic subunit
MWVDIVTREINADEVVTRVRADERGAVLTFIGTVRSQSQGRHVLHLEYEAYGDMARAKLQEIGQEVISRWRVADVAIVHRVGKLDIGATAVVIAMSAPHRADLFAACSFAVDRLKEIVPIWKKEVFVGGEEWVSEHA